MPVKKLKEFLDNEQVKYKTIRHSRAYTSQEIAERAGIPGNKIAKTVMVKVDGKMAMAVLPGPEHVDLSLLKGVAGATTVSLASEAEFEKYFPQCEIGAMPPFGNLYDMDVYVEESLVENDVMVFNAGSHVELIEMSIEDFSRLVKPVLGRLSSSYI